MKPTLFSPRRFFAVALAALLVWGQSELCAATPTSATLGSSGSSSVPAPAGDLVIANGKIISRNGINATVTNVIGILAERFTTESIVIGTHCGEIIIPDLNIHFGSFYDRVSGSVMMDSLNAIVAATNGALDPVIQNQHTYTLTRHENAAAAGPRQIAVFNLGPQAPSQLEHAIELKLSQAKIDYNALTVTLDSKHPSVLAKRNEIVGLNYEMDQQKADSELQSTRRLEQIKAILAETLDTLGLQKNVEVQYHAGANLLIVIGNETALDVATKIVTAMGGTPGSELARYGPTQQTATSRGRLEVNLDADTLDNGAANSNGRTFAVPQFSGTLNPEQLKLWKEMLADLQVEIAKNQTPAKTAALLQRIQQLQAQLIQRSNAFYLPWPPESAAGAPASADSPPPQKLAPSAPAPQDPPAPPRP